MGEWFFTMKLTVKYILRHSGIAGTLPGLSTFASCDDVFRGRLESVKKAIKRVMYAILSLVVSLPIVFSRNIATAQAPAPVIPGDVRGQISYYANVYSSNEKELLKVADCESSFSPLSVGDHGLARGVYQFHPGTFVLFAGMYMKRFGGEPLQYGDTQDQIRLASWMFTLGKSTKRNWSCWSKFYS